MILKWRDIGIICLLFCFRITESNGKQLKFVHVVMRHGDRNPEKVFPTDTQNGESTWKQGLGELTKLGMQQHFALGQWLKLRYKDFMSEEYEQKEIYVRSTGYNRTIQSALANMAGFYNDPSGYRVIDPSVHWTPVPIHSMPREMDPMLWMDYPCPKEAAIIKTVENKKEVKAFMAKNKKILDYATDKEGIPRVKSFVNIVDVKTNLEIEYNHLDEHQPPAWATPALIKKLSEIYDEGIKYKYSTLEWKRIRGGLLNKEITDRMVGKAASNFKKLSPDLKLYMYSAHEWDVLAILQNMDCFNSRNPQFASAVLVELYEDAGRYFVEVHYQNKTNQIKPSVGLLGESYQLPIGNCPDPCPLETFASLTKLHSPADWSSECGYSAYQSSISSLQSNVAQISDSHTDYSRASLIGGFCIAIVSTAAFITILFMENRKLRKLLNDQAGQAGAWHPAASQALPSAVNQDKRNYSFDEKSRLLS